MMRTLRANGLASEPMSFIGARRENTPGGAGGAAAALRPRTRGSSSSTPGGAASRPGSGGLGGCAAQIGGEGTGARRGLRSPARTRVLRLAPSAIKAPLDPAFAAVFAAERIISLGRTLPQATRAVAGLFQR